MSIYSRCKNQTIFSGQGKYWRDKGYNSKKSMKGASIKGRSAYACMETTTLKMFKNLFIFCLKFMV